MATLPIPTLPIPHTQSGNVLTANEINTLDDAILQGSQSVSAANVQLSSIQNSFNSLNAAIAANNALAASIANRVTALEIGAGVPPTPPPPPPPPTGPPTPPTPPPPPPTAAGQPTSFISPSQTTTSITYTWVAPTTGGVVASYFIEWRRSVDTTFTVLSLGNVLTATVTGLASGTSYFAQVTARLSNGAPGSPSAGRTVSTLVDVGTPGTGESAHNFSIIAPNSGTVITDAAGVKWDLVGSPGNYQIQFLTPFSGGPGPGPGPGPAVPAPAAAVGYNLRTYGPNVTLGANWRLWTPAADVTQNGNGSLTIRGGGNSYNAQVVTAVPTGNTFAGQTFGGGGYFEATFGWDGALSTDGGWPAFWANDIENQIAEASGGNNSDWPGQPAGYIDSIELDVVEFMDNRSIYGVALHDWYGFRPPGATNSENSGSPVSLPGNTNVSNQSRYGALWVPATNSTQGYCKFYFNRVQVGNTVSWNKYVPGYSPPPIEGSSAFSIMDVRHLYFILGSGPNNPITVTAMEVWQASIANNLPPSNPTGGGSPSPGGTGSWVIDPESAQVVLLKYYNPVGNITFGVSKHSVIQQNVDGGWWWTNSFSGGQPVWTQIPGDPAAGGPTPPPPPPPPPPGSPPGTPPPPPPPPPSTGGPGTGPPIRTPGTGAQFLAGGNIASRDIAVTPVPDPIESEYHIAIKTYLYFYFARPGEVGNFFGGLTAAFVQQGRYLYSPDVAPIYSAQGLPATNPNNNPVAGIRVPITWITAGNLPSAVKWYLYVEPGLDNSEMYSVIVDFNPGRGDTFAVTPNVAGRGVYVQTSWGSYLDMSSAGMGWVAFLNYNMTQSQVGITPL